MDVRVQCRWGMGKEEDEALSTDPESTSEGGFLEALVCITFITLQNQKVIQKLDGSTSNY